MTDNDCSRTGHQFVVVSRVKDGDKITITERCQWCPAERSTVEWT